jgi:hypothetical protein
MEQKVETFEYAIRKDVRNNPIVREVDEQRQRELWQSTAIGVLLVLVLLFSAWQHFELLRHGYRLEQMQRERAAEAEINRHLRLEIETLRASAADREAGDRRLGMVEPGSRGRHRSRARRRRPIRPPPRSSRPADEHEEPVAEQPVFRWRPTCSSADCGAGGGVRALDRRHRSAAGPPAGGPATRTCCGAPSGSTCARLRRPPSAARSSTATAACSPTASTPTPSTRCRRDCRPREGRAALCGALDGCDRKDGRHWPRGCRGGGAFVYVGGG